MTIVANHAPLSADAAVPIKFDNTYARLPEAFYERGRPATTPAPELLRLNDALARQLRIDPEFLRSAAGVGILSGNDILPGSEPIAQAYAGHQFGNFVPQLGDGRALLLGEVVDIAGDRYDLQLKGSGRTRSFLGAAMAVQPSVLSSANTLSARLWLHLAFRRPALLLRFLQAIASRATASDPAGFWLALHQAIYVLGPFNILPRAEI